MRPDACDLCDAPLTPQPLVWGERRFCDIDCCKTYVQLGGTSGVATATPWAGAVPDVRTVDVALAIDGDHCESCGREININEPVFPGTRFVRCGGCEDAVPESRERATATVLGRPPGDLVTSVLERRAAQMLGAASARHLENVEMIEAGIIARELRLRAAMLQELAARQRQRCGDVCRLGCGCDLFRALGEVQS